MLNIHEAMFTYVTAHAAADTTFLPAIALDVAFALTLRLTIHSAVKNAVRDVDMDVQLRKRMDKLMLSRADAAAKRFCDGE